MPVQALQGAGQDQDRPLMRTDVYESGRRSWLLCPLCGGPNRPWFRTWAERVAHLILIHNWR